jgi:hypothetical protein
MISQAGVQENRVRYITTFSVPLVFEGRYFVLEAGNPSMVSVFLERDGKPVFEILKNRPMENPVSVNAVANRLRADESPEHSSS